MKIKKLIKDISEVQVRGSKDIEITGVSINSKSISPGNLFIAKKGKTSDGSHYITEAISAGAIAVATDIYDPNFKDIVQLIHPNVESIEALLAAHFYQFPANDLFMVGITGTNGKTTTSFLVKHLLDNLNSPCGLIGTIEYIIGQHRYQAARTTPDACNNQKMLREMILQGCESAVMEVSSHALDQNRVHHIDFDAAIFTNLSIDHLDYHHTMENYGDIKQKLFSSLDTTHKKNNKFSKTAIVNRDSPWYSKMLNNCSAEVLSYGIENEADLKAYDIHLSSSGTTFKLKYQGKSIECQWPLIGRHNIYNFMAAAAVGLIRKISLDDILQILKSAPNVSGRLEPVPNALGLNIYVDFAHSGDALHNVFRCLLELKKGRLITVFGCGGDRDKNRRSGMAKAAEEHSDINIITSDNPRTEDPEEICRDIAKEFRKSTNYIIEIDRKKAIEKAIDLATPRDIILIAGRGHETYQIFAHKTIEFDDRKIAAQICAGKV